MKPLTIDELKALQVGDWVWIVIVKPNIYVETGYYRIDRFMCGCLEVDSVDYTYHDERSYDFEFWDYGKTWIAYKNKEQAETKGEIEILEIALDLCEQAYLLAVNGKKNEGISIKAMASDLGIHKFFLTEAETRLKELRGVK